mmetsp:Transcript_53570/g.148983  ORF Transcript_53570/g.148983 Transcript_53570/m.148983 type:complete len:225 (+) Transcript_53570:91-765(+)
MSARALIVGTGHIGSALRARLERRSVTVVGASRSSEEVKLDMSSIESIRALDAQFEPDSIDHVVVCAGSSIYGPITAFDAEAWSANMHSKLLSVSQLVLLLVNELKVMRQGGSITVTTGQTATTLNRAWPGIAMNCAGLNAFVANAGIDLPKGLRLNAVSPCMLTETAEKAGMPTANTISADVCAAAFERLILDSSDSGVVELVGEQAAFNRKSEGLAKTSDMS